MIARRGLGWLPDETSRVLLELAAAPLDDLIGTLSGIPKSVDFTGLFEVADQGNTSSCVGQAFATALVITASASGWKIPRPSAKLIYDFARAEDQPYIRLGDYGSRPLAAIRCLTEKGVVADGDWPIAWDEHGRSNINDRPPLDIYQKALGYKVGGHYRVTPGPGASDAIRQALARGYCPVFAMPVDHAYQSWDERVYAKREGASLGGHMQATCGYADEHILVASSWGTSHGEQGIVRIANSYFDSGEVTDIIVTTVVPALAV